jgi:hypothetical protein
LLEDIRRVSQLAARNGTVTQQDYRREGKFGITTIRRRFGCWSAATKAAGLESGDRKNIPDEELFDDLRQRWISLGRQPRTHEMRPPASTFTHKPYVRRYGSWLKAMKAFCEIAYSAESGEIPSGETASTKRSRDPNLRLRFEVMRRDQFRCVSCGSSPATTAGVELEVDHTVPWSKGGTTDLGNLRTLCSRCNRGKSNLPASEPEKID